jgi:hypothetical protein
MIATVIEVIWLLDVSLAHFWGLTSVDALPKRGIKWRCSAMNSLDQSIRLLKLTHSKQWRWFGPFPFPVELNHRAPQPDDRPTSP